MAFGLVETISIDINDSFEIRGPITPHIQESMDALFKDGGLHAAWESGEPTVGDPIHDYHGTHLATIVSGDGSIPENYDIVISVRGDKIGTFVQQAYA